MEQILDKKYVIITLDDFSNEKLLQTIDSSLNVSTDNLRLNKDLTKAVIKYKGKKPRSLYGIKVYSLKQIRKILKGDEWQSSIQ